MLCRVWTHVVTACLKCWMTSRISIKFGMGVVLMVDSHQGITSLLKGRRKRAFGVADLLVYVRSWSSSLEAIDRYERNLV